MSKLPARYRTMQFSFSDQNTIRRALELALGERSNTLDGMEPSDTEYCAAVVEEISKMQAMKDRFSGPKPSGDYKSR